MIQLTDNAIDHEQALQHVAHPNAGANLLFLGTTRQWTGKVETRGLNYEAYRDMAETELAQLRQQALEKWDLIEICIIHRLGSVPIGEASLAVAVSSPHRVASFEAGQWLIDTLKQVVPIWKQEVDSQGQTDWVHPEMKQGNS